MIPFEAEQWMTRYEKQARFNLADTSLPAVNLMEFPLQDLGLDYGNIDGSQPLRQQIANTYANPDPQRIITTTGCSQANFLVMQSLLEEGDELIVFEPDYQQFELLGKLFGTPLKKLSLDENGQIDFEALEKLISKKTKLIAMTQPNNPMGSMLDTPSRKRLADLLEQEDLYLLCDEVYRMDEPSMADFSDRVIATGSLSKMYGAAGLRCGWIHADPELLDIFRLAKDYHFISAGSLSDYFGLQILKNAEHYLEKNRSLLEKNRRVFKEWLREQDDFEARVFESGSSIMMKLPVKDDVAFCKKLIEEHSVLMVPGSYFSRPGYVRVGLGGIEAKALRQALDQLGSYLKT